MVISLVAILLLVAASALFSLIFVSLSILRAAQSREKVSFIETLLAFLALVLALLAMIMNAGIAQPSPLVNQAAIGLGILVGLTSLITLILERRKPGRPFSQRRSVFGLGLGLLFVISSFVAPVVAKLPLPGQSPTAEPVSAVSAANDRTVAAVSTVIPTATLEKPIALVPSATPDAALLQLSATPTRFPSPTPTPTNTPYIIATTTANTADAAVPADQSSASASTDCLGVVRQNVNLRDGAGTEFKLLLTIPFSTTLNISARNKASTWWYVRYNNQSGWVSGEYVNADASCADLPVKNG
jgi:hypothetical protein